MASAFRGLNEGMDTLIGLRKYELDQERINADRAAQKEERDLRNQQIRLQTAGLQRQAKQAEEQDANQQSYESLTQGMGLAGYDDTLRNKVLQNEATVRGDFGNMEKFSNARQKLEEEGAVDAYKYAKMGDYGKAVQAYNAKGGDRISALEPHPDDKSGDLLIFTDATGKKGTISLSQMEASLADPMEAIKAKQSVATKDADMQRDVKKWQMTEGSKKRDKPYGYPGGGLVFDERTGQYIQRPESQGSRSVRSQSATQDKGLSESQLRENDDIEYARREMVNQRLIVGDPRLDKNHPRYDAGMVEIVSRASKPKFGGDPQAEKFSMGDKAPVWKQGNKGQQKPQAAQTQPPVPVRPQSSPSTLGLKTREQIAAEKAANTPEARQSLINQQAGASQDGRVAEQKAMQGKFGITGKDPAAEYGAIAMGSTRANNDIKSGVIPDLKDLAAAYKLAEIQGDEVAMRRYEQVVEENRKHYGK